MDMMRLFRLHPFFDADKGGGSGGADGGQAAGESGTKGEDAQSGSKITFTPEQQAAIDAIIAERVSRANKAAGKTALEARAKELGFDSVEAMETALKAHKEAAEKDKTDLQKAQEAKAAAEAKAKAAESRANQALIRAAFMLQVAGKTWVEGVSVDDVYAMADLSQVTVKEDGTIEGVAEAAETLLKAKPGLVKATATSGGTGGNPPRGGTGSGEGDKGKSGSFIDRILERQGLKKPEEQKSNFFS
jgi:hypothetical protein